MTADLLDPVEPLSPFDLLGALVAVAHRPNEWIAPGDLGTAIDLTEALVRE
jgi:hypothetical protein